MAITSQKLLPSSKSNSSSIVKAKTTKVSASSLTPVGKKFDVMKDKIFEVDKILKGTLAADKKKITDDKKEEEKQRRNKREDKSEEKKKSPEEKKEKGLKLPKIGFLDRIKNFLTTILLGYVVRRLVGNDSVVGGIGKILEGAAAAVEFTADLTIGVLDGLGSFALFVQNKHKQIEEYSKDKFGEDGVKKFKKLSDALFGLINAFLIFSMVKPKPVPPSKTKPKLGSGQSVSLKGRPAGFIQRSDAAGNQVAGRGRQYRANLDRIGQTATTQPLKPSRLASIKANAQTGTLFGGRGAGIQKGLYGGVQKAGKAFAGAKNFFRGLKIPIIGPILLGIGSYMETGKLDNALFVAGGALIGGILGSFIPIPILGTLLGESIGGYIGDLMYVLLKGGGPESLGQRLKQDLEKILTVGETAMKWIGSGLERYSEGLPKINFFGVQLPDPRSIISPNIFTKAFFSNDPMNETPEQKELRLKQQKKKLNDETPGGNINVKKSNDIVSIGKDLVRKGFSVAEHPDFTKTPTASGGSYTPGEGTVSNVHKGRGHYEGKAIDVTDWRGSLEDSKARYRSVLDSIYNDGNMGNKLLIHDSWGIADATGKDGPGSHGHPEHMHIEVRDAGGKIGEGLFANLGGPEFVIDSDSYMAIENTLPGFLKALNNAEGKQAVKVLENYASYEGMGGETIIVNNIQKVSPSKSKSKSGGSNIIIGSSGVSQTDITYAMG